MRRFREVERNIENVEGNLNTTSNDQSKGYLQIKPKSNITTEESMAIIDSIFKDAESVRKFLDSRKVESI